MTPFRLADQENTREMQTMSRDAGDKIRKAASLRIWQAGLSEYAVQRGAQNRDGAQHVGGRDEVSVSDCTALKNDGKRYECNSCGSACLAGMIPLILGDDEALGLQCETCHT